VTVACGRVQPSLDDVRPGFVLRHRLGAALPRQLVEGVRRKIGTAEVRPGAQLPSGRGLAQQLAINPNTVAKAYAELVAQGWLEARQGLGLYVGTPRQRISDSERERRIDEAVQQFVHEVVALDYAPDDALARVEFGLSVLTSKKTA